MSDDQRCETCASMRQLGHERGGRIAYTVSFWCGRHKRHTSPRKSCAEWAGRDGPKAITQLIQLTNLTKGLRI